MSQASFRVEIHTAKKIRARLCEINRASQQQQFRRALTRLITLVKRLDHCKREFASFD